MKKEVFWKNPGYKNYPELKENIECDYLIVGGGVMGVSLAYFLKKYGAKNIALIEKYSIASGATGRAAGSIVLKGELDLKEIMDLYGEKKGRRYWEQNRKALNTMKTIIKKEKINCDFDMEDTIFGNSKRETDPYILEEYIIEKDIEKLTKLVVGNELKSVVNTPLFKYAILSHNHGISVNPLKFTQNLSKVISKKGVNIYENTPLIKFYNNVAKTPKGGIKFKKIILALDFRLKTPKIEKIVSTITISDKLSKNELKKISQVPKKIIWDSKNIYHYLKITRDNRILLGYGDKKAHKKHAQTDLHLPHLKSIERFLKKLFPQINVKIEYAWSGSFGLTKNKMPLIEQKNDVIILGGAASQLSCLMAANHVANRLTKRKSELSEFFKF